MRCLGRGLAFFVLLFLIAVIPLSIWAFAFWEVNTDPDNFERVVSEETFDRFAPLVLPSLADSYAIDNDIPALDNFVQIVDNMDREEWESISDNVVSPAWLQEEITRNSLVAINYLNGNSDNFTLIVDLAPIREYFRNDGDVLLANAVVESFNSDRPICTGDALRDMNEFIADQNQIIPDCRPTTTQKEAMALGMQRGFTLLIAEFPEDNELDVRQIAIDDEGITAEEYAADVQEAREGFITINHGIGTIFIMPLSLLGLIIFLAVRSAKELFFWTGLTLVLSALLTAIPLFPPVIGGQRTPEVSVEGSTLEELGAIAFFELISGLIQEINGIIIIATFGMIFVGFVCLVLSSLLNGPKEQTQQYYFVPSGSTGGTPVMVNQSGQPVNTVGDASSGASTLPQNRSPFDRVFGRNIADDKTVTTPPPVVKDEQSDSAPNPSDTPNNMEIVSKTGTNTQPSISTKTEPTYMDDRTYIPKNNLAMDLENLPDEEDDGDSGDNRDDDSPPDDK